MQVDEAIEIFESSLKHFSLSPDQTRCEGKGEYLITRNDAEIYIDIWQPQQASQWQYFERDKVAGIFQVIAPICYYPAPELLPTFLEELAHLNFHLFYGSFIANAEQRSVSIQYKRILNGLNETEVVEPIDAIGYYAENLREYLSEKYKTKKM